MAAVNGGKGGRRDEVGGVCQATKRKLDEQDFFGSLLYICYAPEFESIQETRDRRKYIAKATNCKGHLRQPLANGIQQHIHRTPSIFLLHIIIETYYISFRIALPESLSSTHYSHHCATKSACFCQKIRMDKKQQQRVHITLAFWNLEKKDPCDEDLGRLMPQTAQLRE
ncbi:hypothetical protein L345_01905, partial [Ophiophagus hannah]